MRILITENQFKRLLLTENKQETITDEYLSKASKIVKKMINKGFTKQESCAIAGNMWSESQFDSSIKSSNGALGLIQWLGGRKKALIAYAKHIESTWSDEDTQIDFMKIELKNSYKLSNGDYIPGIPKELKNESWNETTQFKKAMKGETVQQKAEGFATKVERCDDCGGSIPVRKSSAKRIYDFINGDYQPEDKKSKTGEKKTTNDSMVGKTVSPKKSGDGYVNVREKADRDSARVVKIDSPNKIGKVTETKTDSEGKKWYKVTLSSPVSGYTSGWVRSDMVE